MKVSVARRCAAPAESVWEWIVDPEKHIQMLPPNVHDAQVEENGDISAVVKAGGLSEPMVVRVVSTEPPHRLVGERVDGNREGSTEFLLKPDGDGCMVTITAEIEVPRLIAAVASGKMKHSLAEQLANLDRLSA